jgi:hypothetical protein
MLIDMMTKEYIEAIFGYPFTFLGVLSFCHSILKIAPKVEYIRMNKLLWYTTGFL